MSSVNTQISKFLLERYSRKRCIDGRGRRWAWCCCCWCSRRGIGRCGSSGFVPCPGHSPTNDGSGYDYTQNRSEQYPEISPPYPTYFPSFRFWWRYWSYVCYRLCLHIWVAEMGSRNGALAPVNAWFPRRTRGLRNHGCAAHCSPLHRRV